MLKLYLLGMAIVGGFTILAFTVGYLLSRFAYGITWTEIVKVQEELFEQDGRKLIVKGVIEIVVLYIILWPVGIYMSIMSTVFHKRFKLLERWFGIDNLTQD